MFRWDFFNSAGNSGTGTWWCCFLWLLSCLDFAFAWDLSLEPTGRNLLSIFSRSVLRGFSACNFSSRFFAATSTGDFRDDCSVVFFGLSTLAGGFGSLYPAMLILFNLIKTRERTSRWSK